MKLSKAYKKRLGRVKHFVAEVDRRAGGQSIVSAGSYGAVAATLMQADVLRKCSSSMSAFATNYRTVKKRKKPTTNPAARKKRAASAGAGSSSSNAGTGGAVGSLGGLLGGGGGGGDIIENIGRAV